MSYAPTVYAITNDDHDLYIGCTADLARRLAQHNDGIGARFTRERRKPWRVLHHERQPSMRHAHQLERWWTSHLLCRTPLPWLTFTPRSFNEKHLDDVLRRASSDTRSAEQIAAEIAEQDRQLRELMNTPAVLATRIARHGGPAYYLSKPTAEQTKAVIADLGLKLDKRDGLDVVTNAEGFTIHVATDGPRTTHKRRLWLIAIAARHYDKCQRAAAAQ